VAWQKTTDKGTTDQKLNYNQLNVGQLTINANHIQAGLGAKDSVEALGQAAWHGWVNQLQNDPKLKRQDRLGQSRRSAQELGLPPAGLDARGGGGGDHRRGVLHCGSGFKSWQCRAVGEVKEQPQRHLRCGTFWVTRTIHAARRGRRASSAAQ
jgi:hypothetical protein